MDIIHRDVKPENILFHDGVIKLGDFGFCRKLEKGTTTRTRVGSPIYMAPEILFDRPYDGRCDIYSLGVLLYECLYGRAPYESNSLPDLKMQINRGQYNFPSFVNRISKSTEMLIRKLLQPNPKKRMTWEELFNYNIGFPIRNYNSENLN